jgi:hypothetical protein
VRLVDLVGELFETSSVERVCSAFATATCAYPLAFSFEDRSFAEVIREVDDLVDERCHHRMARVGRGGPSAIAQELASLADRSATAKSSRSTTRTVVVAR